MIHGSLQLLVFKQHGEFQSGTGTGHEYLRNLFAENCTDSQATT